MKIHVSPDCRSAWLAVVLSVCTACGGSAQNSDQPGAAINDQQVAGVDTTSDTPPSQQTDTLLSDGNNALSHESRQLVFTEQGTQRRAVVQCFCQALYRNTLLFYHFVDQRAVLTIDIGNKTTDFPTEGMIHLFELSASSQDIERWINNQHSDGLYVNPASPIQSVAVGESAVAITSSAYIESKSGYWGDEYEKYRLDFTVGNQAGNGYFLNSFSDHADVYLQTNAPSYESGE